ncbi:glycoside hydrolase family 15 protein [Mycobacterium sp. TY813]|uniref:glycoside hydrolase family 15 protein n=1 Tax=Mycobacterium TaxID=1763 RepID=UPI00274033EC|nr:glycoside hydrolase family 15 protein [Mycobacterium sp. TY813]MDP7732964.1 glycoside hydrolase family 15 protein [Mycobacterium sp. TY813]
MTDPATGTSVMTDLAQQADRAAAPGPILDRDEHGYSAIESYAALGDGRTVALVASDGRIDWLPLPDLESIPPFAALLDADAGGFIALAPTTPHRVTRRYLPHTAVLETTFTTAEGGVVRVTDALNTGLAGRLPWCEVARRIDGVRGTVTLRAVVAPGTLLNTASPWITDTVHGTVLRVGGLTMAVRTLGDDGVEVTPHQVVVDYRTTAGSRHLLGIVSTGGEPLRVPDPEDLDDGVDRTVDNWRRWAASIHYDGPWADVVERSAFALKLLIFAPTGAVAAAATTSLPESLSAAKNWDYRFSWIRDAAFSLAALLQLGVREETHAAISWLLRVLRSQDQVGVLQTLDGQPPTDEVTRYDVHGWRGHGPVVSGNRASDQLQLGVYGDLFNTVALYVEGGNVLDDATARLMTTIADHAADHWHRPDAGIWELEDIRHYTTSKLGCWQALTKAVHLGEIGQIPGPVDRWRHEADAITAWVREHCWSDALNAYEFYPGSDQLDASILLHAISGFDRGERMRRTLDALVTHLGDGPHLYRYTGARDEEATFVACSYWMVAALVHTGQRDRARHLMDRLVATVNDVGLVAEMIDTTNGQFLGNMPPALSHLAIINAALTIDDGDRSPGMHPDDRG